MFSRLDALDHPGHTGHPIGLRGPWMISPSGGPKLCTHSWKICSKDRIPTTALPQVPHSSPVPCAVDIRGYTALAPYRVDVSAAWNRATQDVITGGKPTNRSPTTRYMGCASGPWWAGHGRQGTLLRQICDPNHILKFGESRDAQISASNSLPPFL